MKKCKAMYRQQALQKVLEQATGGATDLPDNPNKWPDPEEHRHTAYSSLFPEAPAEEKQHTDGLLVLIIERPRVGVGRVDYCCMKPLPSS
jgi:hypothetical protein